MEGFYTTKELCEELGITTYTLTNWYSWEKKRLAEGDIDEPYLPQPYRMYDLKGRPRMWDTDMLYKLKLYKSQIIVGRNGIYGKYSNPYHKETKKYKKEMEVKNAES
jgi:hypothetical protein